jgi:hypothetical protein
LNLQVNEQTENSRSIVRINEQIQAIQNLEANIEKVKELFEIRIQEVQGYIYEIWNQESSRRVVEILENGQKKICKEMAENYFESRTMQETIPTNMKAFSETSTREIVRIIMETRNTEEFNEFGQRLFTIQENMKEFDRLENQYGAIFEKGDETSQTMIKIREEIQEGKENWKEKT